MRRMQEKCSSELPKRVHNILPITNIQTRKFILINLIEWGISSLTFRTPDDALLARNVELKCYNVGYSICETTKR